MSVIAAPDHKGEIEPSRRIEALLQRLQGLNDADLARSLDGFRAGGSGHDLWQARDLDTALRELLTESIRLIGADKGIIQKLDAQGDLHIRAQFGYDEEYLSCFRKVSASDNRGCGRAVRTGRPVFIPDVERDTDYRPYVEGRAPGRIPRDPVQSDRFARRQCSGRHVRALRRAEDHCGRSAQAVRSPCQAGGLPRGRLAPVQSLSLDVVLSLLAR